jgi:acetyl-CoA C-acetyltransferase
MHRSPAMKAASSATLRTVGAHVDDVAYLDLYSCFASSLHFATDALGIAPTDSRGLTVTGGLPYHGGPASGYLTHSIAAMVQNLRADPGTLGLVSGVGMHMTKHAFGCYSTAPPPAGKVTPPSGLPEPAETRVAPSADGAATVRAYSVVHDRDGNPTSAVLVCDGPDGARTYAQFRDADLCAAAEVEELVGTVVHCKPTEVEGPMGRGTVNVATR